MPGEGAVPPGADASQHPRHADRVGGHAPPHAVHGADKYWKNKAFGRLLTALGGFPVSRGTADREALRRCIAVLEGGEPLVLFPEGERKSGPIVQPLFDGATYIAVKAGVPIVPVGIGGSERAMPKGAKYHPPAQAACRGRQADPRPSTDRVETPKAAARRGRAS